MYRNSAYICISWYSKICWFPVKKCWCQQNSQGVSRDSYVFWIFLRQGITVPKFSIVGYVWQILGRGAFLPTPRPWVALKKPILNRVKDFFSKFDQICSLLRIWSHLLKNSLMENFIFCAMSLQGIYKTNGKSINGSFNWKLQFKKVLIKSPHNPLQPGVAFL